MTDLSRCILTKYDNKIFPVLYNFCGILNVDFKVYNLHFNAHKSVCVCVFVFVCMCVRNSDRLTTGDRSSMPYK